MAFPCVSVCMVTYQHEKYVGDAMRSVLAQSFTDFELIVVNDGSTDNTAARLAEFKDPRIVVINQHNQGPSAATNAAIAAARGQYIALFSGDDICHPDRLRIQLEAILQNPGALLFAGVDFIDDNGLPLVGDHFASALFAGETVTRAQIMARFFHRGNFLNGVTTFGERATFAAIPYDPTLLQLQDFDLWVRLVKDHDVRVLPDKLVSYRIRGGGGNLSAPGPDAVIRSANEQYVILRHFFESVPIELFREAFAESLIRPDFTGDIEYRIEQAFLFARSVLPMSRAIGVERVHELMSAKDTAKVLRERYDFTSANFFDLLRTADAFNLLGGCVSTIFLDTGGGWIAGQEVRVPINPVAGPFHVRFTLPVSPGLKALRWDAIEGRTCRVRLDAIEMIDAKGQGVVVDLDQIGSNGAHHSDGLIEFETNDPNLWWPCDEGVVGVRLSGTWSFDQLPETVAELRARVAELQAELDVERATIRSLPWRFARKVALRLRAG